ncbi:unnamed protein product [marine sediment metagenome]|uniref:Uncharacterized protein n=1 Tax=marine sediment metagenome TaxID=412755 RepID=X1D5I2_9ZZZZ
MKCSARGKTPNGAMGIENFAETESGEQGVDPNRSTAPLLNSESSVRGSDD